MQLVLSEDLAIDKPLTFDVSLIQLSFSYQHVHLMHAKVFSIQMFQDVCQIVLRVCTLN